MSASMLALRRRIGEIPGEKVAGARNREWRVAAAELAAHVCLSVDPMSGAIDGPVLLVDFEERTAAHAREVAHRLIALADHLDATSLIAARR